MNNRIALVFKIFHHLLFSNHSLIFHSLFIYFELYPPPYFCYLLFRAKVFILPKEEDFGVNVLPINDHILITNGCPTLLNITKQYYPEEKIIVLNMSENYKMDGALTCLSLRY